MIDICAVLQAFGRPATAREVAEAMRVDARTARDRALAHPMCDVLADGRLVTLERRENRATV